MSAQKIPFTKSAADDAYINLSDDEIIDIHTKIDNAYNTFLKQYGVKHVWSKPRTRKDKAGNEIPLTKQEILNSINAKEYQLIFLYKYMRCLVHKDLISAFVRKHIPTAGLDQQVRHLGTQYGWYVLNKSDKIPDEESKVPNGYHYLVTLESPNPRIIAESLKRQGRLAAKTFDELKITYDNKCATCGISEGKLDTRINSIVTLQQGHMDPRKSLTLSNTIPQCQYCNQVYKDYFKFNEYGRVVAINNPEILLRSPRDIQDEMIQVLLKERQEREDK